MHNVIAAINEHIAKLSQARDLLVGIIPVKKMGRPPGKAAIVSTELVDAAPDSPLVPVAGHHTRTAAAREAASLRMKAMWKSKRAAAKKAAAGKKAARKGK